MSVPTAPLRPRRQSNRTQLVSPGTGLHCAGRPTTGKALIMPCGRRNLNRNWHNNRQVCHGRSGEKPGRPCESSAGTAVARIAQRISTRSGRETRSPPSGQSGGGLTRIRRAGFRAGPIPGRLEKSPYARGTDSKSRPTRTKSQGLVAGHFLFLRRRRIEVQGDPFPRTGREDHFLGFLEQLPLADPLGPDLVLVRQAGLQAVGDELPLAASARGRLPLMNTLALKGTATVNRPLVSGVGT